MKNIMYSNQEYQVR